MRADMFGMVWRRMIPAVVAVMGLAVIGSTAERQIAVSHHVALAAAIDDSSNSVGLADSNLARLGDKALIDKQLDMMQSIGVKNVRIGVSWATLQPLNSNGYNWGLTNYDYVVDEALKRGMGILAVLNETPIWAGDKLLSGMPDDVTDYGDFAAEVASHFEGRVSDYEVWNEPNATFFLDPVSPANYTSLLTEAYNRIKDVDQDIKVIGGVLGFGFTLKDSDGNFVTMNPVEFLAGMYAADPQVPFDALSFHPYKPDIKFSDQSGLLTPRGMMEEMRALMIAAGDGDKKIWATEYGLPTVPGELSQQQQADFIKDFLENWGKVDGTGPMFIYSTRDLDTGSDGEQDNYGIWETDWTEKLSVDVIRDFIAAQNGNPIIDFIRNAIVNLAKITGAVIKGIAAVTVGIVTALVDATVWVVKTIAKVTGAVVKGIVDVTKRIATAICNTVHAVVDRIQDHFDRNDPAPALTSPGARSLSAAAADLTTTAAEITAGTVAQDDEFGTAAAALNEVNEIATDGDATAATVETTETAETPEIAETTEPTEATTEVEPTTPVDPATEETATKETATEVDPTTTVEPATEKAATTTTTKDDNTSEETASTKPGVTKQDEDDDTANAGAVKNNTVKTATSTESGADSPSAEDSSAGTPAKADAVSASSGE